MEPEWGRARMGTSMILCFYRQDAENFKENHKIIDVPIFSPIFSQIIKS